MSDIRVVVVADPLQGGRLRHELWDGPVPIVPATTYLQSDANWRPRTVEAKAQHLKALFVHLRRNGWDFWDPSVRRGGDRMMLLRNFLIARADDAKAARADGLAARFSRHTASAIMREIYRLCEFWVQPGESPLAPVIVGRGRGALSHLARDEKRIPPAFTITAGRDEEELLNPVLLRKDVEAVWKHLLDRVQQVQKPPILRASPRGPKQDWRQAKKDSWRRQEKLYLEQLAWRRRQLALWALMLGSGMRLGELPLLMVQDTMMSRGQLWGTLRVRPSTKHLGVAKTGQRIFMLDWDRRIRDAWQQWMLHRMALVARWCQTTGQPDHGMLLVNRDGSPLTCGGVLTLMSEMRRVFPKFAADPPFESGFRIHPHALRHTCEALLDNAGVPVDIIRAHLGHKRISTTQKYGRRYRENIVGAFSRLDAYLTALVEGD